MFERGEGFWRKVEGGFRGATGGHICEGSDGEILVAKRRPCMVAYEEAGESWQLREEGALGFAELRAQGGRQLAHVLSWVALRAHLGAKRELHPSFGNPPVNR